VKKYSLKVTYLISETENQPMWKRPGTDLETKKKREHRNRRERDPARRTSKKGEQ